MSTSFGTVRSQHRVDEDSAEYAGDPFWQSELTKHAIHDACYQKTGESGGGFMGMDRREFVDLRGKTITLRVSESGLEVNWVIDE